MNDNNYSGNYGEIIAARYLREHGYKLLDYQYRCRHGEVDIIAYDKKHICFVEVKTRGKNMLGTPADAVDFHKKERLIATANYFINKHKMTLQPRFDVIEVYMNNMKPEHINHIENAFDSTGK